ncbi:MAG TPA: phosphoglycerate dehydrogenase [Verrucomicrobiales bacterium]|jgi:phosphoglycerate dehydrogenase-like enzyme|nr:phosphoglycerate dehydrogenase [Verrucomicrobiales bacterium]
MSWKVLITAHALSVDRVGKLAIQHLEEAGCEVRHAKKYGPLTEEELLSELPGVNAVMASMDRFTPAVMASREAADLKIISRWGIGIDAVDLPAATAQGIVVCNTPGLLNGAVADYAMGMMLALARRIHEGFSTLRDRRWEPEWGPDMEGKTLGLVGCGGIGQAVAKRARGFDMRLLACDPSPTAEADLLGISFVPFEQLLAESDFLSLHTALTPATRGLIGEAQLKAMKPTAYVINTARGAVIDEEALARALKEGWIAGAALDVFTVEPLPADHPLHQVPNLLLTPHLASLGYESGAKVSAAVAEAILNIRDGHRPRWVVNPEVYQSPLLRAPLKS